MKLRRMIGPPAQMNDGRYQSTYTYDAAGRLVNAKIPGQGPLHG